MKKGGERRKNEHWLRHPRYCNWDCCAEKHYAMGLCSKHYSTMRRQMYRITLNKIINRDVISLDWVREKELHLQKLIDSWEVRDIVKCINKRLRRVIFFRFFRNLTLKETAIKLHLSAERIRQLEAKALKEIRHLLTMKNYKGGSYV